MTNIGNPFEKKYYVFVLLSSIFIANAVLAEIVGVKIFSLENTLGLQAAQIPLLSGYTLDFNLSAGVMLWPVVFIISDIVNEYFGKQGVRLLTFLGVIAILYCFAMIYLVTMLHPATFWLEANSRDMTGNAFNINTAFSTIFTQGLNIIFASVVTFVVAQLADAYIFQQFRRLTGNSTRFLWLRATGSTAVSQLIDSFMILFIAFYLLGNWAFAQVISVSIIQYAYKLAAAILLTPLIYVAHNLIDNYLGIGAVEQEVQVGLNQNELKVGDSHLESR